MGLTLSDGPPLLLTLSDGPPLLLRFTDTRVDEQSRGMSIKAMPMSLVLESLRGKSYLVNVIDCPGHVNFNDEVTAAMR